MNVRSQPASCALCEGHHESRSSTLDQDAMRDVTFRNWTKRFIRRLPWWRRWLARRAKWIEEGGRHPTTGLYFVVPNLDCPHLERWVLVLRWRRGADWGEPGTRKLAWMPELPGDLRRFWFNWYKDALP